MEMDSTEASEDLVDLTECLENDADYPLFCKSCYGGSILIKFTD